MKLSIIVPVYNVERYIERCITSLEAQDIPHSDYEIVIVNDGSKDTSIEIAQKLKSRYQNIYIVNKENGGLSSARNYGIKHAKGDYVWFVDSDDYIECNVLKRLLTVAYDNELDLLAFNYFDIWDKKETVGIDYKTQPTSKVISGSDYIGKYRIGISACFFMVKRKIILDNHLAFIEGIIHEDYEFTLNLYRYIKRMSFENIRVYNYFHRAGSITTICTEGQLLKSIHSWERIIEVESERYSDLKDSYNVVASRWVNNHKFYGINKLFFSKISYASKLEEYKKFKAIGAFNVGADNLDLERKLRFRVLSIECFFKLFMRIFTR